MHCGRLIKTHTDLHMTLYRVTRSWLESGHITARPATVCFSFNGKRSGRTCSVSSCSPQTSGENWHGFIFMWLTEELHKLLDFVSKHVCQMWYSISIIHKLNCYSMLFTYWVSNSSVSPKLTLWCSVVIFKWKILWF